MAWCFDTIAKSNYEIQTEIFSQFHLNISNNKRHKTSKKETKKKRYKTKRSCSCRCWRSEQNSFVFLTKEDFIENGFSDNPTDAYLLEECNYYITTTAKAIWNGMEHLENCYAELLHFTI